MMRFLNTTASTGCGAGVGIEVGNTIYFDMPSDQFSYWNTDDAGRARVRALIQSGHVDCLHSFGDLASTRAHAARALDDLERHGCRLRVWIDHAVAPSNFGEDVMRGAGDVEGSSAYHADLTSAFGIEYVWRGRVTSVIGQNRSRRLSGIASPRHPLSSGVTILKESAKGRLRASGAGSTGPTRQTRCCGRTAFGAVTRCTSSCDRIRPGEASAAGDCRRLRRGGDGCVREDPP